MSAVQLRGHAGPGRAALRHHGYVGETLQEAQPPRCHGPHRRRLDPRGQPAGPALACASVRKLDQQSSRVIAEGGKSPTARRDALISEAPGQCNPRAHGHERRSVPGSPKQGQPENRGRAASGNSTRLAVRTPRPCTSRARLRHALAARAHPPNRGRDGAEVRQLQRQSAGPSTSSPASILGTATRPSTPLQGAAPGNADPRAPKGTRRATARSGRCPFDHAAARGVACSHGALPPDLSTPCVTAVLVTAPQPQLPG